MSISINLDDYFTLEEWEHQRTDFLIFTEKRKAFLVGLRDGTILPPEYVPRHDPPDEADRLFMAEYLELKLIYDEGVIQRGFRALTAPVPCRDWPSAQILDERSRDPLIIPANAEPLDTAPFPPPACHSGVLLNFSCFRASGGAAYRSCDRVPTAPSSRAPRSRHAESRAHARHGVSADAC